MRKCVLVALIGLMSMSVMAGKDNVARVKECDEYWKPIIKEIKDTRKRLQDEWDSMPSWEQKRDTRLFEMICKLQEQQFSAEGARNVCFEDGLAESKKVYEERW